MIRESEQKVYDVLEQLASNTKDMNIRRYIPWKS